jgi:hypothetical protein
MSYPKQVPPGWTRGEPVHAIGTGPRYAVMRGPDDIYDAPPVTVAPVDEIAITFDSREDAVAWLKWWVDKSATS